ncbi:hypothetical protein AXF42_Ash018144 [Apostasia shenzhenica]|uniref:Cystatin domain-containing protein n=1 Tax=Apostasia shenzhenica TaxID=1088818 RepID=A0A2I0AEZ5_9ASPA|nr:hypothetical protein AXF42_Ash018144 [Apostasia shenzhenica]
MASVGNVRLCYQAAASLLLLLLLIIISGSVEGLSWTTHRLTAPRQKTNACLAAILWLNTRAIRDGIPYLLSLVKPMEAFYRESEDGTFSYEVEFVAAVTDTNAIHHNKLRVVAVAKATYNLLAAGQDPLFPLGYVNGNTLRLSFSNNL